MLCCNTILEKKTYATLLKVYRDEQKHQILLCYIRVKTLYGVRVQKINKNAEYMMM